MLLKPSGPHRHPNPPKRQKTAGLVESHYRGNSSHRQRFRAQRGFTHPPQHDYHQMPNQGPYELSGPFPPHHHDPWHPGPSPTNGYPSYGPQFPSPRGPHGPVPRQQDYFPSPYPHYPAEREYPPYPMERRHPPPREHHRGQSQDYWSRSDNIRPIAPIVEPWMEELNTLDIPDARPDPNRIVWRPPQAVARPLPSTLTDRDEITMPPPLSSLPHGMSVSKYILDKKSEEFRCNIRDTEDWPFMMDDPIFLEIPTDGELITIRELLAIRSKVYEVHRIERQPTPEPNRYEIEGNEDANITDANEGPQGDSYAGDSDNQYDDDSRSYVSSREGQDEPIFGKAVKQDSPGQSLDQVDSIDQMILPRRRPSGRKRFRPRNSRDYGRRGDNRRTDGNFSVKRQRGTDRRLKNNKSQFRWHGKQQQQFPLPPPPPNGDSVPINQEPAEDKKDNINSYPSGTGDDHGEDSFQHGGDIKAEAAATGTRQEPPEPRGLINAVRNRHKRIKTGNSSDSGGDEPRRQVDDVTPRMKRRQPQVAEAYSRRW
ncbi:hypothetical protein PRK78_006397 [Emydomyces testavorans]|uniref:Uncharacterized protein n=1 Tax=Emydomyces testavorans TaxID=2070801 RepID=A0AAF0DL97_9EURO|nr:hypothetical protein PRK78_006397 [Emydomyces testavorans]